jgi:inner membrane protein
MIAILALLLLVPTAMVTDIVRERAELNRETIEEVSREWGGEQLLQGPILTVPSGAKPNEERSNIQILPDRLEVRGEIRPVKLHRGIYDVVVYDANLVITGFFQPSEVLQEYDPSLIHWDEAFLTFGLSDPRGIAGEIDATWGGDSVRIEAGSRLHSLIDRGMTVDVGEMEGKLTDQIPFKIRIRLKGSRQIAFLPLGRTTVVRVTAPWEDPSFVGAFLPNDRRVSDSGFSAAWIITEANRMAPNHWVGETIHGTLREASFGVTLMSGVTDYQRTLRSVKYAIRVIALTFIVFFLVEVMNHRRIHPLQYALVGLALALFYLLLVAFSEHLGFNLAYGVAAGTVTVMIGLYSIPAFRSTKLTILLVLVILLTYAFLFVLLQLEEYALLVGSLGLALLLAGGMYGTRNVDWYRGKRTKEISDSP